MTIRIVLHFTISWWNGSPIRYLFCSAIIISTSATWGSSKSFMNKFTSPTMAAVKIWLYKKKKKVIWGNSNRKGQWPSRWGCPCENCPTTKSLSSTMKVSSARIENGWRDSESVRVRVVRDRAIEREREKLTGRVLEPGELHAVLLLEGKRLWGSGLKERRVLHPLVIFGDMVLHVRDQYHLLSLQAHIPFPSVTLPHWFSNATFNNQILYIPSTSSNHILHPPTLTNLFTMLCIK